MINNNDKNFNIYEESEERRKYFLEIDLEISSLELIGTKLSLISSMYYLKAAIIGQEILTKQLNGIDTSLDATPYIDIGETLSLYALFIFTFSAFKRYNERSEQDLSHAEPYKRIALSYIPTLIAYINRINARKDIISDLPNI